MIDPTPQSVDASRCNEPRLVILVGQMPPPVNGFAFVTSRVAAELSTRHSVKVVDLSPHVARGGLIYHSRRLFLALKGLLPIVRHRRAPSRVFYVACEGNVGLVYTVLLSGVARLCRYPTYVHHHSFGYIESASRLMSSLLQVVGPAATHIFLCDAMANRFALRYQTPLRGLVISNSAFVSSVSRPLSRPATVRRTLAIGLLSNLNNEKGLEIFIDVLRQALVQGMDLSAVLAGPPHLAADQDAIDAACREFGERLKYLGPVHGTSKEDFFRSIDVFVFPTQYANEAQPMVVSEAMSYGLPVLTYDRGCLCNQVGSFGMVIPRESVFQESALGWLRAFIDARSEGGLRRNTIQSAFELDRIAARETIATLFDAPATTFPRAHG